MRYYQARYHSKLFHLSTHFCGYVYVGIYIHTYIYMCVVNTFLWLCLCRNIYIHIHICVCVFWLVLLWSCFCVCLWDRVYPHFLIDHKSVSWSMSHLFCVSVIIYQNFCIVALTFLSQLQPTRWASFHAQGHVSIIYALYHKNPQSIRAPRSLVRETSLTDLKWERVISSTDGEALVNLQRNTITYIPTS